MSLLSFRRTLLSRNSIYCCKCLGKRWMSDAKEFARHFPVMTVPMLPPGTFDGKTAFITGGGTGLGKSMAHYLSKLGANVAISSRKMEALEKTANEISADTGRKVLPIAADVRSEEEIKVAIDKITAEFGLPSIIINNAAGNFISPTEKLSYNAFKTIIDIVLNGTANVTLQIGKRLIEAGQGAAVLAISADYAETGSGFVAPSAAAKSGVEALTKSLAAEWGRYGFRFNCMSLGPVETKGAFSRLDPTGKFASQMIHRIPVGRFGDPAEVANLASFLVSDYASWITGQIIRLNGGDYPGSAGLFSPLLQVTKEQWDMMEKMIRKVKGS